MMSVFVQNRVFLPIDVKKNVPEKIKNVKKR